jgi:hypothetical protein
LNLLLLTAILTTVMLAITTCVATFDIIVVWFGVWLPLRKSVRPEDRKFMWRGIAEYARDARLAAEEQARIEEGKKQW